MDASPAGGLGEAVSDPHRACEIIVRIDAENEQKGVWN